MPPVNVVPVIRVAEVAVDDRATRVDRVSHDQAVSITQAKGDYLVGAFHVRGAEWTVGAGQIAGVERVRKQ